MEIAAVLALAGVVVSVVVQIMKQYDLTKSDYAKWAVAVFSALFVVGRAWRSGEGFDATQLGLEAVTVFATALAFYETIVAPFLRRVGVNPSTEGPTNLE